MVGVTEFFGNFDIPGLGSVPIRVAPIACALPFVSPSSLLRLPCVGLVGMTYDLIHEQVLSTCDATAIVIATPGVPPGLPANPAIALLNPAYAGLGAPLPLEGAVNFVIPPAVVLPGGTNIPCDVGDWSFPVNIGADIVVGNNVVPNPPGQAALQFAMPAVVVATRSVDLLGGIRECAFVFTSPAGSAEIFALQLSLCGRDPADTRAPCGALVQVGTDRVLDLVGLGQALRDCAAMGLP